MSWHSKTGNFIVQCGKIGELNHHYVYAVLQYSRHFLINVSKRCNFIHEGNKNNGQDGCAANSWTVLSPCETFHRVIKMQSTFKFDQHFGAYLVWPYTKSYEMVSSENMLHNELLHIHFGHRDILQVTNLLVEGLSLLTWWHTKILDSQWDQEFLTHKIT